MSARVETHEGVGTGRPLTAGVVVYWALSGVAALTSVGIWLLLIVDEGRTVGSATVQMVVKFTNLTTVLVCVVAAWIARDTSRGPARAVAHLTMMVMAVVTAVVNATLLDPALPSGWWGVVDLSQHYMIPSAVVVTWATMGPPFDVSRSHVGWSVAVPLAWLVFVLARGAVTGSYPYDFVDPGQNGWASVLATLAAIVVVMLAIGLSVIRIDQRRSRQRRL